MDEREVIKLNHSDQEKEMGEISRLLQEKAQKGFEFGKSSQITAEDAAHIGQSKSNHTESNHIESNHTESNHKGIDRGRWAD